MSTWRLYTYDVWGNEHDGYQVNDVFRTSETVEFDPDASDEEIIKALKSAGILRPRIRASAIELDGDDAVIYVNDARNGRPEFELRLDKGRMK